MTESHDLDRTLDAWLGTTPAPVAPPDGLARILALASFAANGRATVRSGPASGATGSVASATPTLLPALAIALVGLLALALVGAAGRRQSAAGSEDALARYVNELVRRRTCPCRWRSRRCAAPRRPRPGHRR